MIKNFSFLFLTFFSFFIDSQTILSSYGFSGIANGTGTIDPTPLNSVAGLTTTAFSAVGVSSNPNASGRFSFINWPLGATNGVDSYTAFTGVLTPTAYYEVSLIPLATYTLNLSSISFFVRRSSTGIRNYAVRSNVDNYQNNLPVSVGSNTKISVVNPDIFFWNFDATSTSSDQKGSTINLSATSYTSCVDTLTFRFYAWNAEATGGTFSIDSVVFFGSATNSITPDPPLDVSIEKQKSGFENNFKIYPNPMSEGVLNFESSFMPTKIQLVDVFGKVVFEKADFVSEEKSSVQFSNLFSGTYFLKVYSEKGIVVKKITVAN